MVILNSLYARQKKTEQIRKFNSLPRSRRKKFCLTLYWIDLSLSLYTLFSSWSRSGWFKIALDFNRFRFVVSTAKRQTIFRSPFRLPITDKKKTKIKTIHDVYLSEATAAINIELRFRMESTISIRETNNIWKIIIRLLRIDFCSRTEHMPNCMPIDCLPNCRSPSPSLSLSLVCKSRIPIALSLLSDRLVIRSTFIVLWHSLDSRNS